MNPTPEQFEEAIMGLRHVEQIVIDVESNGIAWQLVGDGGREVVTLVAGANQIAEMLQVTEVFLNTELGIRQSRLGRADLN